MTPDECAQTLDTLAANARACAEWSDAEALSAGAAALRCGWQSIDSAPKDGTLIDVWLGEADAEECEFYCAPGTKRSAAWHWREGRFRPCMGLSLPVVTVRPTYWMALPLAPPEAR